jgi:hypothetical protein
VKLFVIAFAVLSVVDAAQAQDPPPTLTREHLRGPVKSLDSGTVNYIRAEGKSVEGQSRVFQRLSFDKQGNRTEATSYQDGAISARQLYDYDVLGRNTGYEEYYALTNQPLRGPRKHIYALDANGKIIEYLVYETDGTIASRFTYQYDSKGNKIEQSFYAWTGKRGSRVICTYDEAGRMLTETCYDGEDVVVWKNVNTYDAEGRQPESTQYQNGVLRYKKFSKYDRAGRISEQEIVEFNALPSNISVSHAPVLGKTIYAYNDRERSTEISTYGPDGSLKSKEVLTLDEKGNEAGRALFDAKGEPKNTDIQWYDKNKLVRTLSGRLLITFEYDSHGNWTRKTRSIVPAGAKEGEPYGAEYRTITYYED